MWRTLETLRRQDAQHQRALARWDALRAGLPGHIEGGPGDLTICSVAFRGKTCLDLGERLARRLNPHTAAPPWLLFDNNIEPSETIDTDDPRFTVVRDASRDTDMGYEHALGIGALLARVRTRFLLVLDPDCFLVMPDWLRRVPEYMIEHELGFFGTPINPRRHNSYRYFPYMVCMFVDLARVPPGDLCFVPDVWQLGTALTYRARRAVAGIPKAGYLFRWLLTEQWKTNGFRIKAKYGRGDLVKHESVQPVWNVDDALSSRVKRLAHALTPGSVSPVPKQAGYCSPVGFAHMGAPDVAAFGWEEFVWRDRPFAFHVGSVHGQRGSYERRLEEVVERFSREQTV
jgi:hypothetical protein